MADGNLFENASAPFNGEAFAELLRRGPLVVERIVSADGPHGEIHRQSQDEWVVLLRGEATLVIDGVARNLVAGDHVFLAAGTPHVVQQTAGEALWLAVHLHPPAGP